MTTIECVGPPFTYTWPGGIIRLTPGQTVELPDDRAARLLRKVPGRARVVTVAPVKPGDRVSWRRGDGTHHSGVIDDLHIDPAGTTWAFITLPGGSWTAVNLKFTTGSMPISP